MRGVVSVSSPIATPIDFVDDWVRTSSGWLPFHNPSDQSELWIYETPASHRSRDMVFREAALAITRDKLGVQIEKLDKHPPVVTHCPTDSFAHADGLLCGDELVSIAGTKVKHSTVNEVIEILRTARRPTPVVVRRWSKSQLNKTSFAVWIGPNNYRYRTRDLESSAPSGQHRVATDTIIAQVVAFATSYRWVNTVKGWLPIYNPSNPTELWIWEPPLSRRSRNQGPVEVKLTISSTKLGVNIEHINNGPCFVSSCSGDAPAFRAGMRCGDEFVKVAGVDVVASKADQVRALLTNSRRPLEVVVQRWEDRPDDPAARAFDYDDDDAASFASSISRDTSRSVRSSSTRGSRHSKRSKSSKRSSSSKNSSSQKSRKKKANKARPIVVLVNSRTRQSPNYDDIRQGTSMIIRKGAKIQAQYVQWH